MRGTKIYINKDDIKDRIKACWLCKNIGGTIGAPYENTTEMLDVKGFSSEKGTMLPNDDLDLQLVWLNAIERHGPYNLSSKVLAEYWMELITPHWNEYGICKANLRNGISPYLAGEINNSKWKNSNGAWIRSEIWACLCPGFPQLAVKYAYMDAVIDHGKGEGTYAAMFTAAMESIAFRNNSISEIIEEALTYIPSDCMVAHSVRYVIDECAKKTDWKIIRNKLVEMDKKIGGWFMAPSNIGYVILGLLYGEEDLKKSILCAVNCGDDTDCTAATVGAFLGILKGSVVIPSDWAKYIGEKIVTIAIDNSFTDIPKDVNELTERTFRMLPVVLKANRIDIDFTEEQSDFSAFSDYEKWCNVPQILQNMSPYTCDIVNFDAGVCIAELEKEPFAEANVEIKGHIKVAMNFVSTYVYHIRPICPEGWIVNVPQNIFLGPGYVTHINEPDKYFCYDFSIVPNENINNFDRVIFEITAFGRATAFYVSIPVLGK